VAEQEGQRKKFVAACAVVLFVSALVAPVIAQAQQPAPAAKGTEGPDVKRSEKKSYTPAGMGGARKAIRALGWTRPTRPSEQEEVQCTPGMP